MKVTITFKNLEHTPALDQKIHEKSQRFERYLGGNSDIHWICSTHEGTHTADIRLSGPNYLYNASAHSDNLYKTLDQVVNKVERQLQRQKEKWKNKIHNQTLGSENMRPQGEMPANDEFDEDDKFDVA